MTVTAPAPVTALAKLALLALPSPAAAAPRSVTDPVAMMPPPTVEVLRQMAQSGAQQLGTLLPLLERAIREAEPLPGTIGHLARAIGDAAHGIGAGSSAVLTPNTPDRPAPQTTDAWRRMATSTLHDASDLLARAEQRLDPAIPAWTPAQHPELLWAMTQVAGANRQVTAALGSLGGTGQAVPVRMPGRSRIDLLGAVAVAGMVLLLLASGAAYVAGLAAAMAGVAGFLFWTRGIRLEWPGDATSPPPPASPGAAPPPRRPP